MPTAAEVPPSIRIEIDGKNYTTRLRDLTGRDARDFRAVTGFSLLRAMAVHDLDTDVAAGVVWLIRRRTEPKLTYEEVLGTINYENYYTDLDGQGEDTNGQGGEPDPEG